MSIDSESRAHAGEVIVIDRVVKEFGTVRALDEVSLGIRENEFFALLGPSGCGKTTLLRCIGGFEEVTSGRLLLDGEDLVGTKPYDRSVNMMFQSYALFPHMRVWDNVAYGLRAERLAESEVGERVEDVLSTVGLSPLSDRRPHQLSGGQKQRVALARAIIKRPRVLLLDEPLAALDRKLRQEMQIELKRLQHEVGITFIVVTHDQEEAMSMADRVAVLNAGRVLQVGTPVELYDRPVNHFVAAFIGKMNFLQGTAASGGVRIDPFGVIKTGPNDLAADAPAYLAVRPEAARVMASNLPPAAGDVTLAAVVEGMAFVGAQTHLHLRLANGTMFVVTSNGREVLPAPSDQVSVSWAVGDGRVLAG